MRPATEQASFLAGFVCGEGTFVQTETRFRFAVSLGAADAPMCTLLRDVLGVGRVGTYPRRREHYDDEAVFYVQRLQDLVEVIVPFMDEHLAPSYKRTQYDAWRAALLDYWEHRAKRRRPCSINGCDAPNRSKGLCRRHYYRRYGS